MMLQCSDLSASAKPARVFTKKSTVNEAQRSKPTLGVTYTESCSARHWAADQSDSLSELFTLPGMQFIVSLSFCLRAFLCGLVVTFVLCHHFLLLLILVCNINMIKKLCYGMETASPISC